MYIFFNFNRIFIGSPAATHWGPPWALGTSQRLGHPHCVSLRVELGLRAARALAALRLPGLRILWSSQPVACGVLHRGGRAGSVSRWCWRFFCVNKLGNDGEVSWWVDVWWLDGECWSHDTMCWFVVNSWLVVQWWWVGGYECNDGRLLFDGWSFLAVLLGCSGWQIIKLI